MNVVWVPHNPSAEKVENLVLELGISRLLAKLLVNRGVDEPDEAMEFLEPDLSSLHDPHLMKGMDQVLARVTEAIGRREPILVYGDYDVDGITSTVVLRRALEMLGGQVEYHIPMRLEDGYGMKKKVIRDAFDRGVKLVISVDSGIRDFEVCEYAKTLGLDLIVTDHHLPADELPDAYAILNPKQPGCHYPEKDLAAVGVVLKLVQALFEREGRSEVIPHFLKVVAIGTVADMVPLRGENRVIVKHGLEALSDPKNLGLQTLLAGSGVGAEVTHVDIGFRIAPRINAFTRMGGGGEVVDLFSSRDPAAAVEIVDEMNRSNRARRQEEDRILREVEEMVHQEPGILDRNFLLVTGEGWHRGVIGNVAARLVEKYYRPTLVISLGKRRSQGSGRSIPGFHLLEALDQVAGSFEKYGGHAQAVGCTLRAECQKPSDIREM
ncbi:MAG: single-stranded-DNA-specific exonuclease RecJ, partial [Acidobacteriota bacterium]